LLRRRPSWGVIAASAILAGAFLYQIDGYALLDPDEGRNAEVAREMAATGDFVLPHLNGVPYLDKPLVFFATAAAFTKAFGPTPLAARLAPLLFTVLALGVLAYFARRLWGRGSAGTAVVAAASTPFVLAYSRTVIFDSAVMLWVMLALLGFYLAVETRVDLRKGHGGVADLKREAVGWGMVVVRRCLGCHRARSPHEGTCGARLSVAHCRAVRGLATGGDGARSSCRRPVGRRHHSSVGVRRFRCRPRVHRVRRLH
jgi:hypothetical protein